MLLFPVAARQGYKLLVTSFLFTSLSLDTPFFHVWIPCIPSGLNLGENWIGEVLDHLPSERASKQLVHDPRHRYLPTSLPTEVGSGAWLIVYIAR